ncbi:hypothetical protein [Arthrobacter sp. NPDC057013]|uniref:hypothetical protein n=1 Tax=Arthrobacter sp. NPDC057013 TaxID=3345999 RepID=UPI003628045A
MTVLLGAGGGIAFGPWQQTATTMAINAATVWPGDQAVLSCSYAGKGKATCTA